MFAVHNQYGLQVGDFFATYEDAETFAQECEESWVEDFFHIVEIEF